ncbi:hypothetical protein ES706_06372 [subsurface metagenome]
MERALPLALSLAGGVSFLGFEVPNPEVVLYLDLEMGEFEFGTRIQTLLPQFPDITRKNFHGISIPSKQRTSFKINIDRDRLQLINEIEAVKPKLLVIDNHARFHSVDPNVEKDMNTYVLTPFSEWIALYDLSIFYVMHTGWKERERPRGSVAILDAATTQIAVTKSGLRDRTLKWVKNRPARRQQGITRLGITYDFDTFMVETGGLGDVSAILQEITDWPMERPRLAQILMEEQSIGRAWAYRQIKKLEQQGEVIADGKLLRLPLSHIGDL